MSEYFRTQKGSGMENWIASKCPVCGKTFERTSAHAYKNRPRGSSTMKFYCSYHCMRAEQTKSGERDNDRRSLGQSVRWAKRKEEGA